MNRENDWRSPTSSTDTGKVHPNVFIHRSQELSVQIALALGQKTETNLYSREVGYGIARLRGFGLAHEVETQTRELPLTLGNGWSGYQDRAGVNGPQIDYHDYAICTSQPAASCSSAGETL